MAILWDTRHKWVVELSKFGLSKFSSTRRQTDLIKFKRRGLKPNQNLSKKSILLNKRSTEINIFVISSWKHILLWGCKKKGQYNYILVENYGSVPVPGEKIFKSYIGDSNSFIGDNQSYIGDDNCYVGLTDTYIGLTNTYVGLTNPYTGLTNSYIGGNKSYLGLTTISYIGDNNSYTGNNKSYLGLSNTYIEDNHTSVRLNKTCVGDNNS